MTSPRFDWDAPRPRETVAPSSIQARRSGRRRVVATIRARMAAYRDMLRDGPMTDDECVEYAQGIGVTALSQRCAVNATRGDWKAWAEHHGRPCPVVAVSRERKDWGSGSPTTRVRWGWQESEV